MDNDDLDSLVNLVKLGIEDEPTRTSHRCDMSQYVNLYLTSFLNNIDNNGNPTPYDSFRDELYRRIKENVSPDTEENVIEKALDVLMKRWNAWSDMYKYLNCNGHLNRD